MTVERDIIITQRLLKTETKEMALLVGRQVLTTKKVPTMLTKKDNKDIWSIGMTSNVEMFRISVMVR